MAYYLPWGTRLASSGTDPFTWYPALDLNTIPFHVGSGVWGPQRQIQEAVAPTTTRSVNCATLAEMEAEIYTPGTQITLTGDINGGAFNDGDITDIDIIVPSGRLLSNCSFGPFASSPVVTRLRIRGPTVGSFSGGQVHKMNLVGQGSDIIIDGLSLSSDNLAAALPLGPAASFSRGAVVNCRIASGGYAIGSTVSDIVIAGNSIITGLDTAAENSPTDEEAYGIRCYFETNGNIVVYANDIRSNPLRVVSSHSRLRCHPDAGLDYIWASNNRFVERVESHIFQVDNDAGGGSGTAPGVWFTNNSVIAASTGTGAQVLGFSSDSNNDSSDYVYITDNTFESNTFTSNSSLPMNAVTLLTKTGNTYTSLPGSDPAWGSSIPGGVIPGAGDPTGIDWTP